MAKAYSPQIEIFPERANLGSEAFDSFEISSDQLPNGDVQFTVNFVPRRHWPHFGTGLGEIHFSYYPNGDLHSASDHGLRSVPSIENGNVIKCVFSITTKELENPDLLFRIVVSPPSPQAMSFTTYFVRLRKFVRP